MIKRIAIIVDGPPASGKTTLRNMLAKKTNVYTVNYKVFGPFNLIAKVILKIRPGIITSNYDPLRHDPFLLLSPDFWSKLSIIMTLLELLYKIFQQVIIVIILAIRRSIVVDEFLILRFANYMNAYIHNTISMSTLKLLYVCDIYFLKFISLFSFIKYVYLDANLSLLKRNWRKRGHKSCYDLKFLKLVRYSTEVIEEIIAENIELEKIILGETEKS